MKYVLIPLILMLSCTTSVEAKPLQWEPILAHDSCSHFLTSAFLYCWQYEIYKHATHVNSGTSRIMAFGLTEIIGIIKEIFDDKVRGQYFSYKDVACNIAGSLVMSVLWK